MPLLWFKSKASPQKHQIFRRSGALDHGDWMMGLCSHPWTKPLLSSCVVRRCTLVGQGVPGCVTWEGSLLCFSFLSVSWLT